MNPDTLYNTGRRQLLTCWKQKTPENLQGFGGRDGTRTRDPVRDRHVF